MFKRIKKVLSKMTVKNLVNVRLNKELAFEIFSKYFGEDAKVVMAYLYDEWTLETLRKNPNKEEIYKELIKLRWNNDRPLKNVSTKDLFEDYYDYLVVTVLYEETTECFQEWLDTVPIIY